jgi:hypothetical protein
MRLIKDGVIKIFGGEDKLLHLFLTSAVKWNERS